MRVIKKLVDAIKRIQRKNEQKKYNFVFNLGYRYFYDIQETHRSEQNDVDLSDFIYERNRASRAFDLTAKQMILILKNKALNDCYKSAKKFAKQHKRLAQGL